MGSTARELLHREQGGKDGGTLTGQGLQRSEGCEGLLKLRLTGAVGQSGSEFQSSHSCNWELANNSCW